MHACVLMRHILHFYIYFPLSLFQMNEIYIQQERERERKKENLCAFLSLSLTHTHSLSSIVIIKTFFLYYIKLNSEFFVFDNNVFKT